MDCNIALGMYLLESMKENKIKYLINTETFWQNYKQRRDGFCPQYAIFGAWSI